MVNRLLRICLMWLGSLPCASGEETERVAPSGSSDIRALCKRLGRGVNLGNALEAPNEGEWGVTPKEEYFRLVKGWEDRAARGETPTFDEYESRPHDYDHMVRFIRESAAHVRAICEEHSLGQPSPRDGMSLSDPRFVSNV